MRTHCASFSANIHTHHEGHAVSHDLAGAAQLQTTANSSCRNLALVTVESCRRSSRPMPSLWSYLQILGQEVDEVPRELDLHGGAGPEHPRLPTRHLAGVEAHWRFRLRTRLLNAPERKDDIWDRLFYMHFPLYSTEFKTFFNCIREFFYQQGLLFMKAGLLVVTGVCILHLEAIAR